MRPYSKYAYIYPPRPEYMIPSESLYKYDDGSYVGQPKFNGSCLEIYFSGDGKFIIQNRHNGSLSNFKLKDEEVLSLYRGTGYMVLVGEYMNKNQNDETGKPWNHKLVIL